MSDNKMTLRQLEQKINKYVKTFSDSAAIESSRLLDKRMKKTISEYYSSYDPVYYNENYPGYGVWHGARINKFHTPDKVYKKITRGVGNNSVHYERSGGLRFNSNFYRPQYKFHGIPMEDIYTENLLHGRHGYEVLTLNEKNHVKIYRPIVTSKVPWDDIVEYFNSDNFKNKIMSYARNNAKKTL